MTPPPKDTTTTGEREAIADEVEERMRQRERTAGPVVSASSESQVDAQRARQLLRWERCEKEGPVYKLRQELKEQHLERERSMKKAIVVATFVVTAVTGGIQVWGKLSEKQAATSEMAQAMRELRAEVKTLATAHVETTR